jgi:hypothetical protein
VAGALLVLWGFCSRLLPALSPTPNVMLSSAVTLVLAGTIVWGLLPLAALGRQLPFVALGALPLAVVFVWIGLIPLANVAKIVGAAAVGIWIATEIERLSWVVAVAAVSALVDIVSVAVGPTRLILDHGPMVIGYFTVTMTWLGYTWSEAHSAIGLSDFIFLGLYMAAARRFGLRERASAVAMVASFLVTLALAIWWKALPALPLLSVAFLAVNADLLLRGSGRNTPDAAPPAAPAPPPAP